MVKVGYKCLNIFLMMYAYMYLKSTQVMFSGELNIVFKSFKKHLAFQQIAYQ